MKIDYTKILKSSETKDFIDFKQLEQETYDARSLLLSGNGLGGEMTGWIDYPSSLDENHFKMLEDYAKNINSKSKVLLVIGIGGSYLGTKAVLEMLKGFFKDPNETKIMFAGYTISSTYTYQLIEYLKNVDFSINYVSKSGNTTESAIAFRIFRNLLKEKYGDNYNDRIYVTTDGEKGNALAMAKKYNYHLLTIPSNIGGRYGVFTDASLLPLTVVGIDVRRFVAGARVAMFDCKEKSFNNNIALQYAAFRNVNYKSGKTVEVLCVYTPRLKSISEWWKQLYAESEGKDHKGLFPVALSYSTDLHSVGQFIQDGSRILFETILDVENSRSDVRFPYDEDNLDELNYLSKFTIHEINYKMLEATKLAHSKGGTPNIVLKMESLDTFNLGYLMYMFMFSCSISAYMLKVNPFNQPAVQEYKDNMYALLGKPGYEKLYEELEKELNR